MKAIHSAFHGHNVIVGSRKRPNRRPALAFKNYIKSTGAGALPTPPPTTANYAAKATNVLSDIMGNDTYGDCGIAAFYHILGVLTGNATGTPFHASSAQWLKDYEAIGGYVPGKPATDQGIVLLDGLDYWLKTGAADGTKLLGHVSIDATDKNEVMLAMYLFENLYFGMELPDAWITPFPAGNNFTWTTAGNPDPENGHCVAGVDYDTTGVKIATWGMTGTLTWAAVAKYAATHANGELHFVISPDQIAKAQTKAPNGIDWTALLADANQMGGNVPVPAPTPVTPPAPTPPAPTPPAPTPSTGATLSLADAIKALTAIAK